MYGVEDVVHTGGLNIVGTEVTVTVSTVNYPERKASTFTMKLTLENTKSLSKATIDYTINLSYDCSDSQVTLIDISKIFNL